MPARFSEGGDSSALRLRREPLLQETDAERADTATSSLQEPGPWEEQITFRAAALGAVLVFITSTISLRGTLSNSGLGGSLAVPSGLLGFCLLQTHAKAAAYLGWSQSPLSPQENTVLQTCGVAGAALSQFIQVFLSLDRQSYENVGPSTPGNAAFGLREPSLKQLFPIIFLIGFLGNGLLVAFRRLFIVDMHLPFPSSTAVGVLINSLYSESGQAMSRRQLRKFFSWFTAAFSFQAFAWFFQGSGKGSCGFMRFPTFGLAARNHTWNFNFQLMYVGIGMLCPHSVSWSMLAGAVLSTGIAWPLLATKAGQWYPEGLGNHSFRGIFAYQVLMAVSLWFGDGLYNLIKIVISFWRTLQTSKQLADDPEELHRKEQEDGRQLAESFQERQHRIRVFDRDSVPWYFGVSLYTILLSIAAAGIPLVYPEVRWQYVVVAGLLVPPCALANAYGTALVDANYSSTYAKLAMFGFAAWGASTGGGVVIGITMGALVWCIAFSAIEMLQDFRTGYLTLTSGRSMVAAQLLGSLIGCIVAPLTFMMFWNAFPIQEPGGQWLVPFATIYRGIAVLGVSGTSGLPKHCLSLSAAAFCLAILLDALRDWGPPVLRKCLPVPTALAIPFYVGAFIAVDFCVGSIVKHAWMLGGSSHAVHLIPAAATGLIAGDGLWALPAALLAILSIDPPICMQFVSAASAAVR